MSQEPDADYLDSTLALALALANTTHAPAPDGKGPDGTGWVPEGLRTSEDINALITRYGWAAAPLTSGDVAAARQLRDGLRDVFAAPDSATAAAALDRLLTHAAPRARARLTPTGLRVEFAAETGASASVRLATELPLAVARAAERYGLERLRVCADAPSAGGGCRSVFVDTSRNGTRRFCRPQCASRTHVAAFRRRSRAGDAGAHTEPGAD